jgi:hypothetical protein
MKVFPISSRSPLLVVIAAVSMFSPARAHMVWLGLAPGSARVWFNEAPEPGDEDLLKKLAGLRIQVGAEALTPRVEADSLVASVPDGVGQAEVHHEYGVIRRGQNPPFLLVYHAFGQVGAVPPADASDDSSSVADASRQPRLVAVDGGPGGPPRLRAFWQGRPREGVEVRVIPIEGEETTRTTDIQGFATVPGLAEGRAAVVVRVDEPRAGTFDDKPYESVRHYLTLTVAPVTSSAGDDEAPTADQTLARAHQARAVWGPGFPGFEADLTVRIDARPAATGRVSVAPDGSITMEFPDGAERDWARRQIGSMVMHRGLDGPPQLAPGASFLEPRSDHPLGRLIRLADDGMGSSYRIRDGVITEVNRTSGPLRFSNRVLAVATNAEGRQLPLSYSVVYRDGGTGALARVETFHHTWRRVGHLDLPETLTQIIDTASPDATSSVRRLDLTSIRLRAVPEKGPIDPR